MKSFLGNLFGGKPKQPRPPIIAKAPPPIMKKAENTGSYKKGDVIGGHYEVHRTLGEGGFGAVYLAYARDTRNVCALKTFREELLANAAARAAFKREAHLWVNLDNHPFVVAARLVSEFSGRLFVEMDYVAPDSLGRVSLDDHLAGAGKPLDIGQTLKWAVQFCLGMEHALARGIRCHRDIKPGNILISQHGSLQISDFGLAVAAEAAWRESAHRDGSLIAVSPRSGLGLSVMQTGGKARCGTPGYMPPEVYRGEGADVRSDVYSFGLVLWQMAGGSPVPPFVPLYQGDLEGFLRATYEKQIAHKVPRVPGLLQAITERCLHPNPAERYCSFGELRTALEPLLERTTGRRLEIPQTAEKTAAFWNNKGSSLAALGHREEALQCYGKALAIDPYDATVLYNKATVLSELGQHDVAIRCYDRVLEIAPEIVHAWTNKGAALADLGRLDEALKCYDRALALAPGLLETWNLKGNVLRDLARYQGAIACYEEALKIDPKNRHTWFSKGFVLAALTEFEPAIVCYDQALAIDPLAAEVWNNKGQAVAMLGRNEEALSCYCKALSIDPKCDAAWRNKADLLGAVGRPEEALQFYDKALAINPGTASAWINKGCCLADIGRVDEAVTCYDNALALNPRYVEAWNAKGNALRDLAQFEEALTCYDRALAIDPNNAHTWFSKGFVLRLGQFEEAIACYDKSLELDASVADVWYNKGIILAFLQRRHEAITCYDRALAINPQHLEALNSRAICFDALNSQQPS